jgi:hypothetical protein
MKRAVCIVIMLLALGGEAAAATPYELYEQGNFKAAIAAGRAQKSAQGFAIAARAGLAEETMRDIRCLECIQQAQQDARKAIAADPKLPDGHVLLAVSLGQEGRLIGKISAGARRYPSIAKAELDAALAADPSNPFALAALGGWNIEIVRSGGPRLAQWIYGASVAEGLADFNKAFATAPGELVLRYQFAMTLAAYDVTTYEKVIDAALVKTQTDKPHGVYEVFAQARAKQLLDALRSKSPGLLDELLRRFQGYRLSG